MALDATFAALRNTLLEVVAMEGDIATAAAELSSRAPLRHAADRRYSSSSNNFVGDETTAAPARSRSTVLMPRHNSNVRGGSSGDVEMVGSTYVTPELWRSTTAATFTSQQPHRHSSVATVASSLSTRAPAASAAAASSLSVASASAAAAAAQSPPSTASFNTTTTAAPAMTNNSTVDASAHSSPAAPCAACVQHLATIQQLRAEVATLRRDAFDAAALVAQARHAEQRESQSRLFGELQAHTARIQKLERELQQARDHALEASAVSAHNRSAMLSLDRSLLPATPAAERTLPSLQRSPTQPQPSTQPPRQQQQPQQQQQQQKQQPDNASSAANASLSLPAATNEVLQQQLSAAQDALAVKHSALQASISEQQRLQQQLHSLQQATVPASADSTASADAADGAADARPLHASFFYSKLPRIAATATTTSSAAAVSSSSLPPSAGASAVASASPPPPPPPPPPLASSSLANDTPAANSFPPALAVTAVATESAASSSLADTHLAAELLARLHAAREHSASAVQLHRERLEEQRRLVHAATDSASVALSAH